MVSGVYADAVLAGKPVIAHRETWAGSQVSINGNGVLFEPYTAEAMSAAFAKAVADIERLSFPSDRACGTITAATRAQGRRRFLPGGVQPSRPRVDIRICRYLPETEAARWREGIGATEAWGQPRLWRLQHPPEG